MSDAVKNQLDLARRNVSEALSTANAMRDESARLVYLQRAVEAQEVVVSASNAIVDAYEPCQVCGRKVPIPCDNVGGFRGKGPWDFACADYFGGSR